MTIDRRIGKGATRLFWVLASLALLGPAAASAACPNDAVRIGPSAALPDCRAYELVTPPDTNGRILAAVSNFTLGSQPQLTDFELASPVRDSFLYEVYAASLQEPVGGSGGEDVYEAEREAGGWETTSRITRTPSLPQVWPVLGEVSEDHTYFFDNEERTEYLRDSQGQFELVGVGSLGDEPHAQGRFISAGGTHVIFTTGNDRLTQSAWCISCEVRKLEPDAPPTGTGAVYDRSADGPTHVVSLLPGDVPPAAGEQAFYKGTSKDGRVVAFMIEGVLYVRIDNSHTVEVPEPNPVYAGLSVDGSYLFYVVGGTIHRFNTATEADVVVNPSGEGQIVNVSADGSHVYFISEQQLDGAKGAAGQPNLYVWDGAGSKYITTVAPSDLVRTSGALEGEPALANWTTWVVNNPETGAQQGPGADSSRTTPNGKVLVFESKAKLTTYETAGHTEVYRYDGDAEVLQCVSCSQSGLPPSGDARLQDLALVGAPFSINNLSAGGTRVFFETPEALASGDTNEANDIYEWEEADGTEATSLISSGDSSEYPLPTGWLSAFAPRTNLLLSITPGGKDVFFTAKEPLVANAGEGGGQAIYDARVDGGFPAPGRPQSCSEEACHRLTEGLPSSNALPGSESNRSSGNVRKRKRLCVVRGGRNRNKSRRCKHHGSKHKGGRRARSSSLAPNPEAVGDREPVAAASTSTDGEIGGISHPDIGSSNPVTAGSTEDFGIEVLKAKLSVTTAGAHPDLTTTFGFTHFEEGGSQTSSATLENISVSLPAGLIGLPPAVPTCSTGAFVAFGNCSPSSQVGITKVRVGNPLFTTAVEPIYNLEPPHPDKEVARLGFIADLFPVFIDVRVRTASDYGVTATISGAPGFGALVRAETTLWGDPSSPIHDLQRLTPFEAVCSGNPVCAPPPGGHPSGIPPEMAKGVMTNPAACQEGNVGLDVTAYQLPGQHFTATAPIEPGAITDCTGLPFAPTFEAEPTSHTAGAPTGLKTKLVLPQHLGPEERATATMREARVTLPAGMQVAAGAANWIGTCSDAQVGYHEEVDADCPDASKLGTATFVSPDLPEPIEGTIYQRTPSPGHQLGLWLTSDALGLHIKLPGDLEPDPTTGRLTAVFSDLPQVPVEEIDLNVWGGPRAPLQNPDHCGTFATAYSFSPHSNDPAVTGQSTMQITEGCNQPFNPTLHAGVTEPVAGKYSPFVFDLTRADGDQALRGFSLHLPDGELAKLKGVPLCPDADAVAANCPAGSRIGHLQATTGPGPEPFTLPEPGKPQSQIYLAGPYQGAPFSIVSEVPAQAGPFDLGTLAVRSGLEVEPETGRAVVKADPLPQFFEGVGIAYRNLHAVVDRPQFNINPTDCRETAVTADATSTQGTAAHPSARFQVDGCKGLKFKPKLSLKLKGGTERAAYPALTAVLKTRKGDANIARTSVALPHSEFLAQEHIGTICTRKQFAADKCPAKSVYGKAKAITPLLGKPLAGPVYLRSSNHPLPDLVAKLGGELEIDLVGRIDSVHGGIRTTFESVPDAPVTKFVLQMRGGAKGLLTNSTDICRGSHRATAQFKAQNGRAATLRPGLESNGCHKRR